ncbi:hypothetical protein JAO29_10465 [Edaphobacter sp. HDX4]|uniref:hypothetical protein n=1 Tax=Edaphobacter sp. HDX4 TaxID=2794064 RepID=UPI002FE5DC5D
MATENAFPQDPPAGVGLKHRLKRELQEYLIVSGYLAFLFCAISAYTSLLLSKHSESNTLTYTFALINALLMGKAILTGEMMHLGRRAETRPLYQSVLLKSSLFFLLVFVFHFLEEYIRCIIYSRPFASVMDELELEQLVARSIIVFCALIPLFAFRELRRVLGEEKLYSILLTHPGR